MRFIITALVLLIASCAPEGREFREFKPVFPIPVIVESGSFTDEEMAEFIIPGADLWNDAVGLPTVQIIETTDASRRGCDTALLVPADFSDVDYEGLAEDDTVQRPGRRRAICTATLYVDFSRLSANQRRELVAHEIGHLIFGREYHEDPKKYPDTIMSERFGTKVLPHHVAKIHAMLGL